MPRLRPLTPFQEARRTSAKLINRLARDFKTGDERRFLKSWLDNPLRTGAVSPSGRALAEKMASYVDPALPGPVIELGPGTGPVTDALIRRGIGEERLVLLEFNPEFCALLRARYPRAKVIEGDAYALKTLASSHLDAPAAALISSLPLFTRPEGQRIGLLQEAFSLMHPGAPFIQFTYAIVSPIPMKQKLFEAHVSPRIWLNLPPACVWVYRNWENAAPMPHRA